MTTELKIVDWDEALNQVGGDKEFLHEILNDLVTEIDTAQKDIGEGITNKNFDTIMKAAHRIKGSASYLCCERLREVSFRLQNAGHDGMALTEEAAITTAIESITELYNLFNTNVTELKEAITAFQ